VAWWCLDLAAQYFEEILLDLKKNKIKQKELIKYYDVLVECE